MCGMLIHITSQVDSYHKLSTIQPLTHHSYCKEDISFLHSYMMRYTLPCMHQFDYDYLLNFSHHRRFNTVLVVLAILIILPLMYNIDGPIKRCDAREVLPPIAFFNRTIYPNLVLYSGFGEKLQATEWRQRLEREYDYQFLVAKNKIESDRLKAKLLQGPPNTFHSLPRRPLLSIGIISDVQHAYKSEKNRRHYKLSLPKLKSAVAEFNSNRTHLDLVMNLGDLVDSHLDTNLPVIMPVLKDLQYPLYHVLGNHDFLGTEESKFKRIHKEFGMPGRYYSLKVYRGSSSASRAKTLYRLIILDGNDLSLYSTETDSPKRKSAIEVLNSLKKRNAKNANEFNGALGSAQISWLKGQLSTACSSDSEQVIIFLHHTMRPENQETNLWNAIEMVPIISSYGCVLAVINGHAHRFMYDYHHIMHQSVHYVTFGGMVQSPFTSYGFVDVFEDNLRVHGLIFGRPIDIRYNITHVRGGESDTHTTTTTSTTSTIESYNDMNSAVVITMEPVPNDSQQLTDEEAVEITSMKGENNATLGNMSIDYTVIGTQYIKNIYTSGNVLLPSDDVTLLFPIITFVSALGCLGIITWRRIKLRHYN